MQPTKKTTVDDLTVVRLEGQQTQLDELCSDYEGQIQTLAECLIDMDRRLKLGDLSYIQKENGDWSI